MISYDIFIVIVDVYKSCYDFIVVNNKKAEVNKIENSIMS